MGTLREYIRKQSGTFTAGDTLNGYLPEKPTVKRENVTYSPVDYHLCSLFDHLLKQCRNRREAV